MKPYYSDSYATIWHGDSREIVPALGRFDLLVTDPPYGIGFASQPTNYQRYAGMKAKEWDDITVDGLDKLLNADIQIVWGGNYYRPPLSRGWLCWYKPDAPPSMGPFELAWTNIDQTARFISHSIAATNAERVKHPTQKPLAVMSWSLAQVRKPFASVIDPFMGSGTTLRAAKDRHIKCVGIEIEEEYCEMAAKRLAQEILPFTIPLQSKECSDSVELFK